MMILVTGDIDNIIDILELYDIEEKNSKGLHDKLEELAETVSILTRETLRFGFTDEGHLGLYLALSVKDEELFVNVPALAYSGR